MSETPQAYIPVVLQQPQNGGGAQAALAPNAQGSERTLFDLAVDAARGGQQEVSDYLLNKAIEAEGRGGATTLHLPGLQSPFGHIFSLDDPLIKAVTRGGLSPQPTLHKFNETLFMLGTYLGIKDPGAATGASFAFLKAAARFPLIESIISTYVYYATRFAKIPRSPNDKGFEIGLEDEKAKVTRGGAEED